MRGRAAAGVPLVALVLLLATTYGLAAEEDPAVVPQPGTVFEGRASWYGAAFQGRPTANGEAYDKEGLTAAHRTLPFGTLLRVTDRSTGTSVVVRVNDRGPFAGDRVIDLSEAAARLIGLLPEGTGFVSCLVLGPEEAAAFGRPLPMAELNPPGPATAPKEARRARVQVASFRDPGNASTTLERLRNSGIAASVEVAGSYSRIVLVSVPEEELAALVARLNRLGYRNLLISWK